MVKNSFQVILAIYLLFFCLIGLSLSQVKFKIILACSLEAQWRICNMRVFVVVIIIIIILLRLPTNMVEVYNSTIVSKM